MYTIMNIKDKVLILGGGDSPEREVSLRSAGSVAAAAKTDGLEVLEIDPLYDLEKLDQVTKDTLVFPILHGKNGEDGVIQKILEDKGFAYLGSQSQVSTECIDKWTTRQKLSAANIPIPAGVLVTKDNYRQQELSKHPHVLKVVNGGSSIGTLIIHDPAKITDQQLDEIFNMDARVVLEQLIEGTEVTVPILDQSALPVIEIVPPADEEFDYENKYNGRTQELCPPKNVSDKLQTTIQSLAEKVHKTMNARHLSRVDIMIDRTGNLYVLEINTIPGLTDQSLYPKSADAAGISMPQLIKEFVNLIKRDYNL